LSFNDPTVDNKQPVISLNVSAYPGGPTHLQISEHMQKKYRGTIKDKYKEEFGDNTDAIDVVYVEVKAKMKKESGKGSAPINHMEKLKNLLADESKRFRPF